MIITTSESVPGKKIKEIIGIVKGNTVQSRWLGSDIVAGLKNIVGGEIKGYTELMTRAREEAMERMIQEAKKKGADAIINVRFSTAQIMQTCAEMLAYGTAVKFA